MRTRTEIEIIEEASSKETGNIPSIVRDKLALEVLLDIRDLLHTQELRQDEWQKKLKIDHVPTNPPKEV